MADVGRGVRDVLRLESLVDRRPCLAAIIGAKCSGGRNGDEHAFWIYRIEQDGMQAHAACTRLPVGAGPVAAKPRELLPRLAAVGGVEQSRVLDAGVHGLTIGQRRLKVPDALELPGMGGAVVPLVSAGDSLVGKVIADWLPGFAAVARALDLLAEPAARLRDVDPVGLNGRTLDMIDFPAGKVGTTNIPLLACPVRLEDERTLPSSCQNPHSAHNSLARLPPGIW